MSAAPSVIGRYALSDEIASGGMATVFFGRLNGAVGFSRIVAIKRLHPHFAKDPEFSGMFLDEARLAARIHHPNVVQTLDVESHEGELLLVMEYVQGESLHNVMALVKRDGEHMPLDIASAIVCGVLHGLHAAHEATNDRGEPLDIVHRDVSPQNIIIGADGVARVLDFGVAKAAGRLHTTQDGSIKGKLSYMSPEQLQSQRLDRRTDIFAAGVVLWECIVGERLFRAESDGATVFRVLEHEIERPSKHVPEVPRALDEVVMRALQRPAGKRFGTAREMALALEAAVPVASSTRVATWLEGVAGDVLSARSRALRSAEETAGSQRSSVTDTMPNADVPSFDGPNEEVSNVSVATSRKHFVSSSRPRLLGYGVVALVALGVGFVVSRFGTSSQPLATGSAQAASASGATLGGPGSGASAVAPASVAPPIITPSGTDAPPLVASADPHASGAPVGSAAAPQPSGAAKHPHTAPHPSPKKPCTTSYIDDAGIKQYRSCP